MIPKFRAYVKEVNKTYEITEIDFGDEQLKTELGDWWSFDEVEIMQSTMYGITQNYWREQNE